MRIAMAADHHGIELGAHLAGWLRARGHGVDDRTSGPSAEQTEEVDYPALCADLGRQVASGAVTFGIVIGGSGQGEVIACNKIRGVRAGLCHTPFGTQISRGHNNANVLVMGAKLLTTGEAEEILAIWLDTPFKGGRHRRRVDQIAALESEW